MRSKWIIQRLKRQGVDLHNMASQSGFQSNLEELDESIRDLMQHEGYSSEMFVAPGVPRIRPILIFLSSEVGKSTSHQEVEASGLRHLALSAELFYTAIVVHDFALGRSGGLRRRLFKKILNRALKSHENSWLGGSHLITRSIELMMMTHSADIMNEFIRTMREVQDAQRMMNHLNAQMPTSDDVLNFVENYTGEMFAFACRAGGMMAQAPRQHCNWLARYGRALGVAWHLTEEVAYLSGEQSLQSLAEQIAMGRPFYIVALAAEDNPKIAALWEKLQNHDDEELLQELFQELNNSQVLPSIKRKIVEYVWLAQNILAHLPQSPSRDQLEQLVKVLVK